ncbi:hypoxanthine phosphoribosyltransferase [Candidatus Riflebacteria bacterium]
MFQPEYVESILISEEDIKKRVKQMGSLITRDFIDRDVFLLVILQGSIFFATDLSREIKTRTEFGFMAVSSYGDSTQSSGEVKIVKDLDQSIKGKNVIIVEDIVDTGLTLSYLTRVLLERKPKVLRIASLLCKPSCLQVKIDIDYLGFSIEDKFVIGYGLDFIQFYRNLPYIGILKEEYYSQATED